MRVLFLTNEYPPNIYGGAGVHVEYLSKALAALTSVEVRSFHEQASDEGNLRVRGTKFPTDLFAGAPANVVSPLKALATCLAFNGQGIDADVVHCHTWYTHFGGLLAKQLYGTPLVVTLHSLEPLRPWKREQLGRGYDLSSWVERTTIEMADAVIAVSRSTRDDALRLFDIERSRVHVIANGIDTEQYRPIAAPDVLARYGIDETRPYALFVGRMTRQKGLRYLLKAIPDLVPSAQVVLCAGESDTPELQAELEATVRELQGRREGIVWIPGMVSRETTIALYSHARVFCCPSIYEPFGIINLEALACGTPVVGSKVGGIAEILEHERTGLLVEADLSDQPPHDPRDGDVFARGLADALNRLLVDGALADEMGRRGRDHVVDTYGWDAIARQTLDLYETLKADRAQCIA